MSSQLIRIPQAADVADAERLHNLVSDVVDHAAGHAYSTRDYELPGCVHKQIDRTAADLGALVGTDDDRRDLIRGRLRVLAEDAARYGREATDDPDTTIIPVDLWVGIDRLTHSLVCAVVDPAPAGLVQRMQAAARAAANLVRGAR